MYFTPFYARTVSPLCFPCDVDCLKKGGPLACTISHVLDVCFLVVRKWSDILLLSLVFPVNRKLERGFWLHSDLGQGFFLGGAVYLVLHRIGRCDWKSAPPFKVLSDQSGKVVTSRPLISPLSVGAGDTWASCKYHLPWQFLPDGLSIQGWSLLELVISFPKDLECVILWELTSRSLEDFRRGWSSCLLASMLWGT